jgi:hypothetical protein
MTLPRGAGRSTRSRRVAVALATVGGLPALSGCSFDAQIAVRFTPAAPAVVHESLGPEIAPQRRQGVTSRRRQVVGIDCAVTVAYDVREATGSAVLVQTLVVRLRTRPLPRATPYTFDCNGPLVLELPAEASGIEVSATGSSGQAQLPVKSPVPSVLVGFGGHLRPEPGTQLAVVAWPSTLPAGDYGAELAFTLPQASAFREKAVATASISCGRSHYLQPVLPPVARMSRVPAFGVTPSSGPPTLTVPRVAAGIASSASRTRRLSCG